MGIDGIPMSSLGMKRNRTSAQIAMDNEATARQSLENQIPDVDGIGKKEKAGRKDPEAAFNNFVPYISDKKKKNKDSDIEEEQKNRIDIKEGEDNDSEEPDEEENDIEEISEDDDENASEEAQDTSKYHFKYTDDDMIEIYNSETNEIIKKISIEQAANVSINIKKMPGIFINKKV